MLILSREEQGLISIRLGRNGAALEPLEVWTNKENMLYLNSPVLQGSSLFAFSVRNKGQFVSIDADTGKTLWQGPGRTGENAAILNLGGKVLLMLTNDAKLFVLPATVKEFAPIAQYTVAESPTWAHPLVIGNRILIKDETSLRSLTF
jgi:hypothetical protein